MSCIAVRRAIAGASLSIACCTALADDVPPRILQEPVFGLRFDVTTARLDPVPDEVLALCPGLSNEQEQMHLWTYAVARDAARTYYVAGGYYVRPKPPHYALDTVGAVFHIEGATCTLTGPARETFDARLFEENPQPILRELAADLARRLALAFGGPDQLAAQFRRQHIESASLSPELREAFKRYLNQ